MDKYDITCDDCGSYSLNAEKGKGDWVLFKDVEKLESELKSHKELLRKIGELETHELESVNSIYGYDHEVIEQNRPLNDEYCGDYVETEELKALLKEVE